MGRKVFLEKIFRNFYFFFGDFELLTAAWGKTLSNFRGAFPEGRMGVLGRGRFDFVGGVSEEGKTYTKRIVWGEMRVFHVFTYFSARAISDFCDFCVFRSI